MTEKMDLRRAKVRLLDLAHDLELADMPTEADALRCMARGPTFTERDREVKEPEPKRNCPITRGGSFDICLPKGCTNVPIQPATPNVTERDQEVKEPEPKLKRGCCLVRVDQWDVCRDCGDFWDKSLGIRGCTPGPVQLTTPNVPRNVPNHGSFGVSKVFTYDNNPAFIER